MLSFLDPVLVEILTVFKAIKVEALVFLGPMAPVVTAAGQIVAAAISLFLIIAGRGLWAPPAIHGLPNFAARVSGVVAGLIVVGLFLISRRDPGFDFLEVALYLAAISVATTMVYLLLYLMLTFTCKGDKMRYVRGFVLKTEAKDQLNGNIAGLQPPYKVPGSFRPSNVKDYFCNSGKDPDFIWTELSHAFAQVILMFCYFMAIVPLTGALASGSLALMGLDVSESPQEVRIELPADVLFSFNESVIRDAAIPSLEQTAAVLRKRSVKAARIEGHTDSKGSDAYNQKLSVKRAEAVRDWLASQDGLYGVRFTIVGLGSASPVAPNTNSDGSDNPFGRQRNRRVTILIEKSP